MRFAPYGAFLKQCVFALCCGFAFCCGVFGSLLGLRVALVLFVVAVLVLRVVLVPLCCFVVARRLAFLSSTCTSTFFYRFQALSQDPVPLQQRCVQPLWVARFRLPHCSPNLVLIRVVPQQCRIGLGPRHMHEQVMLRI